LTCVVFAKRVVRASENAAQSTVFGVGPRISRAVSHTFLGRVVCEGHRPRNGGIGIRTSVDTRKRKVVSIGFQVSRAIEDTPSCVVVSILVGRGTSTNSLALSGQIACPGS